MPAIRATQLSKSFNGVPAVSELTLEVPRGEIFGLIGPDGAGKTTTLRMLATLLTPDGGRAEVLGRDPVRDGEALKGQIGYMSQRFGLYPDLSVEENLEFFADLYDVPAAGRRAHLEALLDFGQLGPFRRRLAGHLSGGMKQKLGLACALVHRPPLLLLDEPTNGVDPLSRREFWRILVSLRQEGVTIVITTAYLDEADCCQRVGLLDRGRLLACDTPAALRRRMPGTLLELRCAQPRRAVPLLHRRLPAVPVNLFGDRLHLVAADATATTAAATALLEGAGLGPVEIRPVPPSFEDLFIALLSGGAEGRQ